MIQYYPLLDENNKIKDFFQIPQKYSFVATNEKLQTLDFLKFLPDSISFSDVVNEQNVCWYQINVWKIAMLLRDFRCNGCIHLKRYPRKTKIIGSFRNSAYCYFYCAQYKHEFIVHIGLDIYPKYTENDLEKRQEVWTKIYWEFAFDRTHIREFQIRGTSIHNINENCFVKQTHFYDDIRKIDKELKKSKPNKQKLLKLIDEFAIPISIKFQILL